MVLFVVEFEIVVDVLIVFCYIYNICVRAIKCLKVVEQLRYHVNKVLGFFSSSVAVEFAVGMGFQEVSLQTNKSRNMWETWKNGNCQPNFREVHVLIFQIRNIYTNVYFLNRRKSVTVYDIVV